MVCIYIYIYINNLCVRSCLSTNCYHLNLVLRFNAIKQSLAVHRAPWVLSTLGLLAGFGPPDHPAVVEHVGFSRLDSAQYRKNPNPQTISLGLQSRQQMMPKISRLCLMWEWMAYVYVPLLSGWGTSICWYSAAAREYRKANPIKSKNEGLHKCGSSFCSTSATPSSWRIAGASQDFSSVDMFQKKGLALSFLSRKTIHSPISAMPEQGRHLEQRSLASGFPDLPLLNLPRARNSRNIKQWLWTHDFNEIHCKPRYSPSRVPGTTSGSGGPICISGICISHGALGHAS